MNAKFCCRTRRSGKLNGRWKTLIVSLLWLIIWAVRWSRSRPSESELEIMKFTNILASLACVAQLVAAQVQWPVHNNSLNTVVEWDHYSYIIKGQRLFIWSGEVRNTIFPFWRCWSWQNARSSDTLLENSSARIVDRHFTKGESRGVSPQDWGVRR